MIRRSRSVGLGALLVLVGAVEVQAAPTVALRGQAPWVERLTPALLEVGLAIQSSTVGAAGWVAADGEGELLRIRWVPRLGPPVERTFNDPRLGAIWVESQLTPPSIVEFEPASAPRAPPATPGSAPPESSVSPPIPPPTPAEGERAQDTTLTASAPPSGRAAFLADLAFASRLDDQAAWWNGVRGGVALPFENVWIGLRAEYLTGTDAFYRPQRRPNHLVDVQLVGSRPFEFGGLSVEPELGLGVGAAWRAFLPVQTICSSCGPADENFAIGPRVSAGLGVVAPVGAHLDARLSLSLAWSPLHALERSEPIGGQFSGIEVAGSPPLSGGVQVGLRWRPGGDLEARDDRWLEVIEAETRLAAERRAQRDRSGELTTRFGAGISPSPGNVTTFLEACGNLGAFCFGGRVRVNELEAAHVGVDGLAVAALPWRVGPRFSLIPSLGAGLGYHGGNETFGLRGELGLSLEFPFDGVAPGVTGTVGIGQPAEGTAEGLARTFVAHLGFSLRVGA